MLSFNILKRALPVGALACVLLGTQFGCVSEVVQPARDTKLFVVSTGDSFTLSWQSEPKTLYTVWYADRMSGAGQWKPLPGAERIRGTGREIRLTDRGAGAQRYYRLSAVPTD